jgi:hypothetical protein
MYVYKCVPVPTGFEIGRKNSHLEAVKAYQDLINQEASQGWEYVNVDVISSEYTPGCLSGFLSKLPIINLFIRDAEVTAFKFIIFKRQG